MKKLLVPACVMLAAVCSFSAMAEEKESECLEVGANPPAFNVQDVTGDRAPDKLCYRCRYGARPVVAIFTRKLDDNVAKLTAEIDAQVGKNGDKKMAAFVVLLTDDPDAAEGELSAVAKKNKIKNVPLTIFDGVAGPPSYKLDKNADNIVMMWVDNKVKVNEAFTKGKLDEKSVSKLADETTKILD